MQIVFAVMGLIFGLVLGRDGGWLYGLLGGLAIGLWVSANDRVNKLQKEIASLKTHLKSVSETVPETAQATASETSAVATPQVISNKFTAETKTEQSTEPTVEPLAEKSAEPIAVGQHRINKTAESEIIKTSTAHNSTSSHVQSDTPGWSAERSAEQTTYPVDKAIQWLKTFFTTGNVIVKVGVIILFFGVAFLMKYAAERSVFPIELRLAGIGAIGVVLLLIGWRLREKKTAYALVLQGGALGVLYLTVFSALRLYDLLPATLAFSILFVFATFSAALAVLQNSRALAVLALSGGFLAPILTSTGSGSHVALFSYYLVLNLGVFGIAWFRSWRLLNVLGFVFTFVVAAAWGYKYYTPDYFNNTEPFLIAFYLLYVAIAILFAFKQPVQLKGYVDSSLVFGVPLVGFGLQAGMVNHIEYALAWSSLTLAALYIGLASILWKRLSSDSRLLCEAFLALGVIFATLAVPFALDAQWTAGTWALEGAAAVWTGSRQGRILPRLLGYFLQLAGGITFLSTLGDSGSSELFMLNGDYLGALTIALSGLFVAWLLTLPALAEATKTPGSFNFKLHEHKLSIPFLIWGLIWWFAAGFIEIDDKMSASFKPLTSILFMTFSVMLAQWCKEKLRWSDLRLPALSLLPFLVLIFPAVLLQNHHPFGDWNIISWVLAITTQYMILKRYDELQSTYTNILHMAGVWFIVILLSVELAWQVDQLINGADTWWLLMTGLVPAILMLLMYRYGQLISWPVLKHQNLYQIKAMYPVGFGIWLWFILMNLLSDGEARPLSYLPLLNPLDIVLAVQLIVLIYCLRFPLSFEAKTSQRWRFSYSQLVMAASIFLWLNTMWLRLAHHVWLIEFDLSVMAQSSIVQAGLSILWSVTGLSSMIFSARKLKRETWIAGAVVMAAVVLKLFMFDLANSGTVERIVSFISVGLLLLVVGYYAPVPPQNIKEEAVKADEIKEITDEK